MQTFEARIPTENGPDLIAVGSWEEGLEQLRTLDGRIVAPEDYSWGATDVELMAGDQWRVKMQDWLDDMDSHGSLQNYQDLEGM